METRIFHMPTNKQVRRILANDGERAFCDFGNAMNPFTWVKVQELARECPRCGDSSRIDQSCGCFDNDSQ